MKTNKNEREKLQWRLLYLISHVIVSSFSFDSCIDLVSLHKVSSGLTVSVELGSLLPVQVESQSASLLI